MFPEKPTCFSHSQKSMILARLPCYPWHDQCAILILLPAMLIWSRCLTIFPGHLQNVLFSPLGRQNKNTAGGVPSCLNRFPHGVLRAVVIVEGHYLARQRLKPQLGTMCVEPWFHGKLLCKRELSQKLTMWNDML